MRGAPGGGEQGNATGDGANARNEAARRAQIAAGTSGPDGVITLAHALASGLSYDAVRARLAAGSWQRLHRRVYATFSGPIPRRTALRAAVLAAGDGATLSHYTAAELAGLTDRPLQRIHVTIAWPRRIRPPANVVVHVSRRLDQARHPNRSLPQTRIEETVLDLANVSATADRALGWVIAACSQRLTTPARIESAMAHRARQRWRRELAFALRDIEAGCDSPLESAYLREVERAHGLPDGKRQVRHARVGGAIYDDVHYASYGLVVELDGRNAHRVQARFRDHKRDNVTALRGDLVLHYGWDDVTRSPCEVAAQVAQVLAARGWLGQLRSCGRDGCTGS